MKNAGRLAQIGYAWAGIRIVYRREKSFRTQCLLGVIAIAVTVALRPGWVWAALVSLAIGLVLALELANAAIEYLIDRLHPEIHEEIGHAKDAAAGAVLTAAFFGVFVGVAMVLAWYFQRG